MNNDDRAKFEAQEREIHRLRELIESEGTRTATLAVEYLRRATNAEAALASAQAASAEPVFVIKSPGEQAAAWRRIAELLHELKPEWCDAAPSGIEAAEKTIRYLATPAPVASAEPVACRYKLSSKDKWRLADYDPTEEPQTVYDYELLSVTPATAVAPAAVTDEQAALANKAKQYLALHRANPSDHLYCEIVAAIDALTRTPEPQAEPAREWRCFHCDETFTTTESAELHFGKSEHDRPFCQISVEHFRWMEVQHRRNVDDDSEALRAIGRLTSEHETLRRRAEESGYARGLADAKKHPEELGLVAASHTSDEQRAQAAQEDVEATVGPRLQGQKLRDVILATLRLVLDEVDEPHAYRQAILDGMSRRIKVATKLEVEKHVEATVERLWETIKILGLSNDRLAKQAIRAALAGGRHE